MEPSVLTALMTGPNINAKGFISVLSFHTWIVYRSCHCKTCLDASASAVQTFPCLQVHNWGNAHMLANKCCTHSQKIRHDWGNAHMLANDP